MFTPLIVDDTELHNIALNTKRPDMPKRRTVPTSSAAGNFQFWYSTLRTYREWEGRSDAVDAKDDFKYARGSKR